MIKLPPWFDPLDVRVTNVMARLGVPLLRGGAVVSDPTVLRRAAARPPS
ncbi:MAG: hypothetical protein AAB011_05015 [Candidatus Eisenbacteria bacterium]